jgi:hypothetical protein
MIEPCFMSINATTHYKESNYRILLKREVFNKNQFLLKKMYLLNNKYKKESRIDGYIDQAAVRHAGAAAHCFA